MCVIEDKPCMKYLGIAWLKNWINTSNLVTEIRSVSLLSEKQNLLLACSE